MPLAHRVTATVALTQPHTLYTSGSDGSIFWWSFSDSSYSEIRPVAMLCGHSAPIADLSICYPAMVSSDGKAKNSSSVMGKSSLDNGALVSACTNGVLCVWSRSSGHCRRRRKLPPWVGSPSVICTLPSSPRYVCIGCCFIDANQLSDHHSFESVEGDLVSEDKEALYHALPMNYVTIAKLQNKLDKDANESTVCKLIDKMIRESYVEAKGSRRLGKRVINSSLTEKKLMEVKKALDIDFMEVETNELVNKLDHQEFQKIGSKHMDTSTCGALHSVGSDVTRTKGRSDIHQSGSFRSEQTISKAKFGNTLTSWAGPVASRESFVPGNEKIRTNGSTNNCDEVDDIICSRSTQDKRLRKTSTVKEPILQHVKR